MDMYFLEYFWVFLDFSGINNQTTELEKVSEKPVVAFHISFKRNNVLINCVYDS